MKTKLPILPFFLVAATPMLSAVSFEVVKRNFVSVVDIVNNEDKEAASKKLSPMYEDDPRNETYYSYQAMSNNYLGSIETVWNHFRGEGTTIAIIDTGIAYHHEDFWKGSDCHISNKSAYFYYDDYSGHVYKEDVGEDYSNVDAIEVSEKTHGCSTSATAAATISGHGTVGVAPEATILNLKIDLSFAAMREAIYYAVDNGADVINMSLGAHDDPGSTIMYDFLQPSINYAYQNNVFVIASAGNESTSDNSYPACNKYVIGVGALAQNSGDILANYSNFNKSTYSEENNVDIVAPGTVYTAESCFDGVQRYAVVNGTSFSSPITAGAAALYRQKHPQATYSDFEQALYSSADDIGSSGWDTTFGNGRLNIGRLLDIGEDENEDLDYNPTTTKEQDSTTIWWEDQIGWQFTTLHVYSLEFYSGYTYKDFHNYMTIELGNRVMRQDWAFEGRTAGWCFNVENTYGDYLLHTGDAGSIYTIHLPWWILKATYQFVNNSNWKSDANCKVDRDAGLYKKEIKSYIYGSGQVSTPTPTQAATYNFKAIKVTRKAVLIDGTVLETVDSTACIYDYLNMPENYAYTGYHTVEWYLDEDFTIPYRSQIVRNDITVYALQMIADGTVYFQSQDWGDSMYCYEYFMKDGAIIEPLGKWPGSKMSVASMVTFNNAGLWYVDINVQNGACLVFNNNNHNQSTDINLINGAYYYPESNANFDDINWIGSTEIGEAAQLVIDINNARMNVQASENIKEGSICGLASLAEGFIARYNELDSSVVSIFDNSTIYTYNRDLSDGNENVTMANIMEQLNRIILLNGISTNRINAKALTSNACAIVISISLGLILCMGLLIKKRKQLR